MSEPKIVTGKVEPDRKLSAGLRILIRMEWDREGMVMLTMKRMMMMMMMVMNRYFDDMGMTGLYMQLAHNLAHSSLLSLLIIVLLRGNWQNCTVHLFGIRMLHLISQ